MVVLSKKLHINSYDVVFTYPDWASGLGCLSNCGYCCISELPANVPTRFKPRISKVICAHYDMKKQLCSNYSNRPFMCKLYPLIIGLEDEEIKLSAMLGCPATNKNNLDIDFIRNTLQDAYFSTYIQNLQQYMIRNPSDDSWKQVDSFFKTTKNDLLNLVSDSEYFPTFNKVNELLTTNLCTFLGIPFTKTKMPTVRERLAQDIKNTGVYIATRFSSFDCLNVSLRGNRVTTICLDGKRKKFSLIQPQLSLNQEALEIFKDYIEFLFKRPLLYLTTIVSFVHKRPSVVTARDIMWSVMNYLDVAITLIGSRDRLTEINKDSLREMLSYIEPDISAMFVRPDIGQVIKS